MRVAKLAINQGMEVSALLLEIAIGVGGGDFIPFIC